LSKRPHPAAEDEGLNRQMMGLSDSLYFYLKFRLLEVEIALRYRRAVYKAPPVQVPANSDQLAEVLAGVQRLTLVPTAPTTVPSSLVDLDRVVRIVAEYTQLTPTAKTQLLKALASV